MTDDGEALAALAAQVEDLRGVVAKYQGIVAAWDARLEREGIGGTLMLRLEVKQLQRRLDEALDKHKLAPPPAPWWCVGTAEGKKMLAELCEWVDEFFRRHYPDYIAKLPGCWVEPPGGRLGAVNTSGRVGAHLRQSGQQGPGGRPVVA